MTATFPDWAYTAGILRLAGPRTQFRHKDLQDWLFQTANQHPTGPPGRPVRTESTR